MLVVSGETAALRAMPATCRQRAVSTAPASASGSPGLSPQAAASHAQAMRHGSCIAAAPPGMRTGRERREALESDEIADEHLPAPDRAVRPVPRAVVDRADGRALEAVLGEARGEVGVVVLDARRSTPSSSSAYAVDEYSGCRS